LILANMPTVITPCLPAHLLSRSFNHVAQFWMKFILKSGLILGDRQQLATFKPAFKVRYIPKGRTKQDRQAEFEELCRMASAAKNCTFVIEELGRYTMPSYAPPAWSDCCNDGRHDGLHLIAASQFPAQIDKAFLGNATLIHCGYLGEVSHRKCVAEKMDIDPQMIKDLPNLSYLQFDREARTTIKGRVKNPYA
ncbi:MAG: hypothetical protein ACEQSE_00900, partial [Candidatus Aquirickettsiella gammari]